MVDRKEKTSFLNWYDVTGLSEINMKVRACQGVSMFLVSYLGVTTANSYEIVFGDIMKDDINSIRVSTCHKNEIVLFLKRLLGNLRNNNT